MDSVNSSTKRSRQNYLAPWIVNLLLEYKEPEAREDGQFGHVLKVLNGAKAVHHDKECPEVVLHVSDGCHYIRTVVAARALTTCCLPGARFSKVLGQFIILKNYSVCFKEATKMGLSAVYINLLFFPYNTESNVVSLSIQTEGMMVKGEALGYTRAKRTGVSHRNWREAFRRLQLAFTVRDIWIHLREDCEFYLVLHCFQVISLKRKEMKQKQQNCNQEPSVLQKIKELWQKSFALQPNSAPSSVSEVVQDIKDDKLNILKQNVSDCLSLLDSTNQLNSEQLDVYPKTKWQVERKEDKVQQHIFTIPAKFLMISAENEEILRKSYPPKPCAVVSDTSGSTKDDDNSTASFFSESQSLNGSLENPWDVYPAMTLTSSSDTSGSPSVLPCTQQAFLAKTTKEETLCSSSCTPDFLESCVHTLHRNSEQAEPAEAMSPTLFQSHKNASLKGSVSQDSAPLELNIAHNTSKMPHTEDSISCGQPLMNSHSHTTMSPLPPLSLPTVRDPSHGPLSENELEDHCVQGDKVVMTGAKEGALDTSRKAVAVKRKQMIPAEDRLEAFTTATHHTRQNTVQQPSTAAFPKSNELDKLLVWKPSSKLVSTPKKSRREETHVQHCPAVEASRVQHPCRNAERHQERERKQRATEDTTSIPVQHFGVQEQEYVRRPTAHVTYEPPTPDVCSQVCSTRISRALLGWARWIFNNSQGQ